MKLEIKQYREISPETWDNFVYSNSMGWAYFLYDVIAIDRNVHYINKSFCICDEDNQEILAMFQLYKDRDLSYMKRLKVLYKILKRRERLISRWGYILKDNLNKKDFQKIKECFENYIDAYMLENKIDDFSISLAPLSKKMQPNNCPIINPLIYFNFSPLVRYTYVINLSKEENNLFYDMEQTTRNTIRRYEKSKQYKIVESKGSAEDLKTYIKLHKETYTRTGASDDIIDDRYHENMFFKLIPQKICRVFFLEDIATKEYIAQVAILLFKNTAYYWWGASKTQKPSGINKYLLYKVICIIRQSFEGNGFFETGGAYLHIRHGKEKGLNDFKKCFGTFLHPIYKGTYIR